MEKMAFMSLSTTTKTKNNDTKKKHETRKSKATSNNNLIMCFKPAVLEPVVFTRNDNVDLSFDDEEESGSNIVKKLDRSSSSRRFSRVWKAMFEASTSRKVKKGKSSQGKKSPKLLSIESARYNYQETSKKPLDQSDFGQRIISRSVSALATSSSISSSASDSDDSIIVCPKCSIFETEKKNKKISEIRGCYESISGLVLLLVILLVLVFCGKVFAIFCTTTWLFLMPRLTNKVKGGRIDLSLSSSPESNKKIIIEELFDRRRRSFRCQ